jgi:hypothetical protein
MSGYQQPVPQKFTDQSGRRSVKIIDISNPFIHIRNWYARFERPISSVSLVSGFIFNALTLKRVDMFWENFWIVSHLLVVAICIVCINMMENENECEKNPVKAHFWLVNILQFFFGGLLSTFLVFYFRSSDLSTSWPFFLVLALAFWANESLKRHYARLSFQISLFYLSLFLFTIFFVPVVEHKIGPEIFFLAGAVSLISIGFFLLILAFVAWKKFSQSLKIVLPAIAGIFIAVNLLYFFNLIPPIPLSLKAGGVCHSVMKDADGNYVLQYEAQDWRGYMTLYPDFHLKADDPVYVYSAVFSPPSLNTTIVHEWQYDDPQTRAWTDSERIELSVVGGRDGGFRTYSIKTGMAPGHWRVTVATLKGKVIGRVRFNVVATDLEPSVQTRVDD